MFAGMIGGWEWVIVILAVLIFFGARKIPELARGLGQGIKEFKKATREVTDEIHNAAEEKPVAPKKSVTDSPSQSGQTVSQSTNPPKV